MFLGDPFATLSLSMSSNIYNHVLSPQDPTPHLLVFVCLPDRNAEGSGCDMLVVTKQGLCDHVQNPTNMKVQYLRANHFVNGLNGMLLRGPSG
jgi:hypothetical protein